MWKFLVGVALTALLLAQPATAQVMKLHPAVAASAPPVSAMFVGAGAVHLGTTGGTTAFSSLSPSVTPLSGDMVCVETTSGNGADDATVSVGSGGAAYTKVSANGSSAGTIFVSLWCRVLASSGEVSAGFTVAYTSDGGNTTGVAAYRGPTHFALATTYSSVTTSTVTTGVVTPAVDSAGIVYYGIEQDDNNANNLTGSPTAITGDRLAAHVWTQTNHVSDILSGYPGGTTNTLSGWNGANGKALWTVDMTP